MRRAENFFREAMTPCERLKLRAIFLTPYGDQVPADLPSTIRHFKFVSLSGWRNMEQQWCITPASEPARKPCGQEFRN